jgi:hypothetical protein
MSNGKVGRSGVSSGDLRLLGDSCGHPELPRRDADEALEMTVVDSFTPFDFKKRDNLDQDLGSTGVTLLPAFAGTAHPHLAIDADKSGTLRLLDVDNLGGFNPGGPDRVLQEFTANPNGLIYSSPVYFDGKIYIQGVDDVIKAFALKLDPTTNTMMLDETPVSQGTTVSGFPGEVQSISANGTRNGIVWSAQVDGFASNGPAILRAYNANDLSTPLYSSNQAGPRDTAGGGVKFTTPTIANGMVYLGTQFEVDVYGLLHRSKSGPNDTGDINSRASQSTVAQDTQTPKRDFDMQALAEQQLEQASVHDPAMAAGPAPRAGQDASTQALDQLFAVGWQPHVRHTSGAGVSMQPLDPLFGTDWSSDL